MSRSGALALAAVLAIVGSVGPAGHGGRADASVWDGAVQSTADAELLATYDAAVRTGDEHVAQANTYGSSLSEKKRQVRIAIDAYRRAATSRPTLAEPYFRVAETLYSFYLDSCADQRQLRTQSPLRDCQAGYEVIDRAIAQETIDALDAAEARAPLDPRFSAGDSSVLFERALLHTRLATMDHFRAASRDYEAYLVRAEVDPDYTETAWANLAETYMMIGDLDRAIDGYREALRASGGTDASTWFGYAVALDRDGRTSRAHETITDQGIDSYATFRRRVEEGTTFFVPVGEQFYYFALAEEAFGHDASALRYWQAYLESGAHPQYQPRARAHITATSARLGTAKAVAAPPIELWDLP